MDIFFFSPLTSTQNILPFMTILFFPARLQKMNLLITIAPILIIINWNVIVDVLKTFAPFFSNWTNRFLNRKVKLIHGLMTSRTFVYKEKPKQIKKCQKSVIRIKQNIKKETYESFIVRNRKKSYISFA